MSIGKRIKELREIAGISQAKLAKAIGVSPGNVGEWELGRTKPGADALIALSKYFKVTTDWILTGESSESTQILEDNFKGNETSAANSIGARIKNARKNKGLTQTDVQNLTGISSGNLSDIENDKSMPSAAALISLSRELGVSIDWILTGEERFAIEPASPERKASGYSDIDLSPQDIEFFAKVKQLTKENRIKVEGIVEGLLISQDSNPQGRTGASSRSTNGYEREEAAAKSKLA